MITHEEIIEISKHYNLNINQSSTIEKYALQQQAKDRRLKKIEELLEIYKGIDGGGSPEGLNKLYRLRDELEKELKEMK